MLPESQRLRTLDQSCPILKELPRFRTAVQQCQFDKVSSHVLRFFRSCFASARLEQEVDGLMRGALGLSGALPEPQKQARHGAPLMNPAAGPSSQTVRWPPAQVGSCLRQELPFFHQIGLLGIEEVAVSETLSSMASSPEGNKAGRCRN